jgi:hypothetical protein
LQNKTLTFQRFRWAVIFAATLLLPSVPAAQQPSSTLGEDASILRAWSLRAGVNAHWSYYDQLFSASGGTSSLRPAGALLSFSPIGSAQIGALAPYESSIRSLSNQSDFTLSLGSSTADITNRTGITALTLEAGLPGRFMFGVDVPLVRVERSIGLSVNRGGSGGNVGVNPALTNTTALSTDNTLIAQMTSASTQLSALLTSCQGSTSSQCTQVNARRSEAQALVSASASFATALGFFRTSPLVPLTGSAAQTAIAGRVTSFGNSFRDFGITSITSTGPAPAQMAITTPQFREILGDTTFGIQSAVPDYRSLTKLGDIRLYGKFQLLNAVAGQQRDSTGVLTPPSIGVRAAITGAVSLPTGGKQTATHLFVLNTGEGAVRTEIGATGDFFFGKRFWISGDARLFARNPADMTARIDQPVPSFSSVSTVRSDKSISHAIAVFPRYTLGWLTIAAQYQALSSPAPKYVDVTSGTDVSIWNGGSATSEQRLGGGLEFSNLLSGSGHPIQVSFTHSQTLTGTGLAQPKYFLDQVRVRIYGGR